LNDKKIKQAALEFAQGQPVQWDAFLVKWEAEHSEPAETVTLKPEVAETEIVKTSVTSADTNIGGQETIDTVEVPEVKKRKAAPRKAKAADS